MIPRYATPSIITRSLARRAPPTHKGPVTSPGLPTRTRSQSIDWRSFHTSMLGNLESFLGNSPGLTAGGPGSHRGLSCSRERFWLRKACALEHHEADYCVVSITLFSSRICRSRNHTSCGHLRCVCGNLSREIWSRIGSEVNSGDFPDRNLEVWVDNVVAHPRNHALNEMRRFFWWIPTSVMLLLLGVVKAREFFALETLVFPERCGEIRDGNCMLKIMWKQNVLECP